MSRAAQDWAASQTKLDPAIRWTLWHLADYAKPDGSAAFPSVKTLAQATGQSERTIQRHLRELEQFRYVQRGDDGLVAHYLPNRRPAVWDLRMNPGQSVGIFIPDPVLPLPGPETETAASGSGAGDGGDKPGDNPPSGVSQVTPLWGDTQRRSGVTLLSPNPRTKKELTRARARGQVREPCSPACEDPTVGLGRGWLADDPVTLAPRPCPLCRRHQPRVRWN